MNYEITRPVIFIRVQEFISVGFLAITGHNKLTNMVVVVCPIYVLCLRNYSKHLNKIIRAKHRRSTFYFLRTEQIYNAYFAWSLQRFVSNLQLSE